MPDDEPPEPGFGGVGEGAEEANKKYGDGGGPILPDWVSSLKPLKNYVGWIVDFARDPRDHIQEVFFGVIITGIAWFVDPILDGIIFLFGGSNPGQFAARGEQWGLADLPVAFARMGADILSFPIEEFGSIIASIIRALTMTIPGPLDGLVVNAVLVAIGVALARYGPLVVRSALEAIPVIGGPLSTLLGGAD